MCKFIISNAQKNSPAAGLIIVIIDCVFFCAYLCCVFGVYLVFTRCFFGVLGAGIRENYPRYDPKSPRYEVPVSGVHY